MLLDEDPATLIHHTIGNFNINPDKQAVTRISDSLSTLHQSRDLNLREAESAQRKLTRNLNSLTAQHDEAVARGESANHAEQMVELDAQKFRLTKSTSEVESENERIESELDIMKERLADLEAQGLEGDEGTRREREADDATILRLKIYRSLGIDIEPDEAGNFTKAIIRNSRKGDVHVVNIDPKFSQHFYANLFWSRMQG